MPNELQSLRKAREINSSFPCPEPVKQWKSQGKKVIGFGCTYVPEEIIYASGMLPIRVYGNTKESGLDEADAWLHVNTCSYERSRFQMVLDGEYSFLDGFVSSNMCDQHGRTLEVMRYLNLIPFIHLLQVPQKDDEYTITRYLSYYRELISDLERHFDVQITDEDFRRGIAIVNRKRRLLQEVNALRLADAPPISGTEVAEVMNAGFLMPSDEFSDLLEELLVELRTGNRRIEGKFRLMLGGGPLNNTNFIAGIEELGGIVVTDELCMGTNYWVQPVEEKDGESPLEAIAGRYNNKIPCPRRSPFELRLDSALTLAREYRVDGLVLQVIRNCFPHGYHAPTLAMHMDYYGIPVLQLEKEYGTGATGQIITRVQAFLESLEGKVKQLEQQAVR